MLFIEAIGPTLTEVTEVILHTEAMHTAVTGI
jgi:hypothetical protein